MIKAFLFPNTSAILDIIGITKKAVTKAVSEANQAGQVAASE